MLEESLIEGSHIFRCRTVNENRIKDVHVEHILAQFLRRAGFRSLQLFAVMIQVDAVAVENGILRTCDSHHIQFQTVALFQLLILVSYLFDEFASYRSHSADEEVEYLVFRKEERIV